MIDELNYNFFLYLFYFISKDENANLGTAMRYEEIGELTLFYVSIRFMYYQYCIQSVYHQNTKAFA